MIELTTKPCPNCGKPNPPVQVTQEQLDKRRSGALIQNAFPHLSNAQRETLLTGTCSECWDKMFRVDE